MTSHGICPYPVGPNTLSPKHPERSHILSLLTLFIPKVMFKDGQITPNSMTHPYYSSDLAKAVLAGFWILGSGFLGFSGHVQRIWQTDFDAIFFTDYVDYRDDLIVHAIT